MTLWSSIDPLPIRYKHRLYPKVGICFTHYKKKSQNDESSRLLAELERQVKGSNMVAALSSYVDDADYSGHFQEFDQVILLKLFTWEVRWWSEVLYQS